MHPETGAVTVYTLIAFQNDFFNEYDNLIDDEKGFYPGGQEVHMTPLNNQREKVL